MTIHIQVIQILGDSSYDNRISDDDGVGALNHGLEVDVGLVARPLSIRQRANPDEAVHGCALRCRRDEFTPIIFPSMRHECIGLALVPARQGVIREAAAQLLRDGLDEVDDHFFGLPLPEIQRKG